MLDPVVLQIRREIQISDDCRMFTARGESHANASARELRHSLRSYIYRAWHGDGPTLAPSLSKEDLHDDGFYARLRAVTEDPLAAREVPCLGNADCGLTSLQGIRVRFRLREHCQPGGRHWIHVPKLRPYISPGYIYYSHLPFDDPSVAWRVYVNAKDMDSALAIWKNLVGSLPRAGIKNFHAKVAATEAMFSRRDALVVYLESWNDELRSVFESLVESAAVNPETSAITCRIAAGVSVGQEPRSAGIFRGMSFGQHRSHVLANALVDTKDMPSSAAKPVIAEMLTVSGIDPLTIYRNAGLVL